MGNPVLQERLKPGAVKWQQMTGTSLTTMAAATELGLVINESKNRKGKWMFTVQTGSQTVLENGNRALIQLLSNGAGKLYSLVTQFSVDDQCAVEADLFDTVTGAPVQGFNEEIVGFRWN